MTVVGRILGPDGSWGVELDGESVPPVHTQVGHLPPQQVGAYHLEFAKLELARPLEYYEARVKTIGFTSLGRVLDAGCGVGQWCAALGRHNDEVHGIDRSEERLALAERLRRAQVLPNVHLTHGDVEDLPYTDGYFDAVFCYGVLMFLEPEAGMRELSRVLRPGGRLYLSANGVGWSLLLILRRRLLSVGVRTIKRTLAGVPRDNYLTRRRVEELCGRNGLRVTAFGGEGTVVANGAAPPTVKPVYPGSFLGLTCVFEALADKATRAQSDRQAKRGAPSGIDSTRLRRQGSQIDAPQRAVPADVVHVERFATAPAEADYGTERLAEVRRRLQGIDETVYLDSVVAEVLQGARTDREAVERIIVFLQDAVFHHPLRQPPLGLPVPELLELGEGRCGHVSRIAVALLRRAGLSARGRQLPHHVIAEVFVDGDWRIVDPDVYKNGVIPRAGDGSLLSMRDLERNPYRLDRFPPTGLWARTGTPYARNEAGVEVTGYVDVVDFEDRGYLSWHYAAWAEREYPPSIPRLRPQPDHLTPGTIRLEWEPSTDRDGDLRGYRIRVGTTSKGWSFDRAVYSRLLKETGTEVGEFETREPFLDVVLEHPGVYFWSVKAFDDHMLKERETFYWSSDEQTFRVR